MGNARASAGTFEKRRIGVALGLAVLLHALAYLLLPRGVPVASEQPSAPLIVELREIERPPPVAKTAEPEVTKPARVKRKPRPRVVVEAPPSLAGVGETPAQPAPPAAPPREVDLFDSHALEGSVREWAQGLGTSPDQGGAGEDTPQREHARVSGRVDGELEDTQATSRVRNGMVDPYFGKLAGGFRQVWKPPAGLVDGSGDGISGHLKSFLGQWSDAGRQFAATGSPFPTGTTPTGSDDARPITRPGNGSSGFDPEDFRARWNGGEFAGSGALVVVRLEQDSTGAAVNVEVLASSGSAELDVSAVEAVRGIAGRHTPPEHGLGLGDPVIRSVWKFHARVVSNTCAPVMDQAGAGGVLGLGCGGTFDAALGEADAELPFERKVIATVELVALYGGELLPFDSSEGSSTR